MKFGLYLPNFGPLGNAHTLADLAADAEAAGWDGFFIWDHIARAWVTEVVDPWVALSAVAMTTTRLRIGALITPLPRRRPWKVARETVSLDHLSGGRLVVGVGIGGSGGRQVEWQNFGEEMDLRVRGAMLDEALEILTGLWSGRPFTYAGRHYRVEESRFLPVPLQSPRIPVWVAGQWPHRVPFRRAARWDGMFPEFPMANGDVLAQLSAAVAFVRARRANDAPFDVVHAATPTPGDDPVRAAEIVRPYAEAGVTWWLERLDPPHFGEAWQAEWPLDAMRRRIRQGPPARA
jgi:alkanesulfonate monooxygenase SsuD/methylene tetrahydromethanopterin reductase-like flavin-dependent oxidoreductase (luciferase family)